MVGPLGDIVMLLQTTASSSKGFAPQDAGKSVARNTGGPSIVCSLRDRAASLYTKLYR